MGEIGPEGIERGGTTSPEKSTIKDTVSRLRQIQRTIVMKRGGTGLFMTVFAGRRRDELCSVLLTVSPESGGCFPWPSKKMIGEKKNQPGFALAFFRLARNGFVRRSCYLSASKIGWYSESLAVEPVLSNADSCLSFRRASSSCLSASPVRVRINNVFFPQRHTSVLPELIVRLPRFLVIKPYKIIPPPPNPRESFLEAAARGTVGQPAGHRQWFEAVRNECVSFSSSSFL